MKNDTTQLPFDESVGKAAMEGVRQVRAVQLGGWTGIADHLSTVARNTSKRTTKPPALNHASMAKVKALRAIPQGQSFDVLAANKAADKARAAKKKAAKQAAEEGKFTWG